MKAVMADAADLQKAVGSGDGAWFATSDGPGRGQLRAVDGSASKIEQQGQFVPTVFLYDNYPGGVGQNEPLWRRQHELVVGARALIERCDCKAGCPACVGPVLAADDVAAASPKALNMRVLAALEGSAEPDAGQAATTQAAGGCRLCGDSARTCSIVCAFARPSAQLAPAAGAAATAADGARPHAPGQELAPGLHYREERLRDGPVPLHFDGAFDRREHPLPTSNLLFFDTETTGLAGGTGTRAFMIGAADWHEDALRIRQLTMSTMAAETAMLEAFRGWLAPDTVLVSYNGKCYDAPLLATRYRLARMDNRLSALSHVDLLYLSRRRYRGVHENCRLATIERQVLRVVRNDDLPGSEAPAAWLSYLRGGGAHNLIRVLTHNHQDVVSLSRLLRHLVA